MSFFFIQMTDPQFGMFASISGMGKDRIDELRQRYGWTIRETPKITGFANETTLYERAIAAANRLNPAFVIVSGDMVQDRGDDPSQLAEVKRITGHLSPHIPIYWAAGNHDVGGAPTPQTLARYREWFGPDYYCFEHGGSSFIVLNSSVGFDDSQVPQEWDRQLEFLRSSLQEARNKRSAHIIVFVHYPLFLEHPDEEDSILVVPRTKRKVLLDLLESNGVSAVFSGHLHYCHYVEHNGIQMVTTGPVGYPLRDDPSGLSIVKVFEDRIEHQYYGIDSIPEAIEL